MHKLRKLRTLGRSVFSPSKRRKVGILLRERLAGLRMLIRDDRWKNSALSEDPPPNTWVRHESRKIDPVLFEQASVSVFDNRIGDDGVVRVEHRHVVQALYGASSCTNDLTHRSVFRHSGERVAALSYAKPRGGMRPPPARRLPISRHVDGVTANLYGNLATAEGNYCHWFVDAMSRLFLIERFHSLDTIDHVLVPPLKYDFQWDSLAAFGIDRAKVLEMKPLECPQFDRLLASSPPRGKGSAICPAWLIERYRTVLLEKTRDTDSVAGKRVYISRRDAPNRMFSNEGEVCDLFANAGFDIVELTPLNLWQKIAVFRDAEVIVGQTGAGLTNLMFGGPTQKVLELVDKGFVYPLYASLAVHSGGSHHVHYFSDGTESKGANAMVARSSIDLDALDKSLSRLQSG